MSVKRGVTPLEVFAPDEWYTTGEVAEKLKLARSTVNEWAATREIPSLKVGKAVRLRGEDLNAFVQYRQAAAAR